MTAPEQLEILCRGTANVTSQEELLKKLERGQPLRAKLGVDPTSPDLHLGHSVVLEKLRQFQELGHQAVLIIGDFTAQIGDPSGRSKTRPPLSREQILEHAETYTEQAFRILDKEKTEVVFNGEWFNKMTFAEVIQLNARVTMQQMLQREDFKNRIANNQEVRLHEIQYPIVQGWDSVVVKADVELGGTDQLFNILVGRDLQKSEKMEPQVVMCLPILEGLDGVKKMSKSLDNYIGVSEPATEMFGKMMSISDELMARYATLLLGQNLDSSLHPMEAKKQLAQKIVTRYHSTQDADDARATWEARFSQRDTSAGAVSFKISQLHNDGSNLAQEIQGILQTFQDERSLGAIRKQLILPGAIQLNGEKLTDPTLVTEFKKGDTLRLSKKLTVVFE